MTNLCLLSIDFRVGFVMQINDDDNNDKFGGILSDFNDPDNSMLDK